MSNEDAEWRQVVGFEGLYEVSADGRVRSLTRMDGNRHLRLGQELKPALMARGYPRVQLYGPGGGMRSVHRLVAEAFIPNPEGLPIVRHLNDIPDDNRVENLAWGTDSDNKVDAVRNGLDAMTKRTHCPANHPYDADNTYVTPEGHRRCRECDRQRGRDRKKGKPDPRSGNEQICPFCGEARSAKNINRHIARMHHAALSARNTRETT